MKKTKSLNKNMNLISYYYSKLNNIIPTNDLNSYIILKYIINKKSFLNCSNPNCQKVITNNIYCIFDTYCCSDECKNFIKIYLESYWNKL
jgi:hypothetical protein